MFEGIFVGRRRAGVQSFEVKRVSEVKDLVRTLSPVFLDCTKPVSKPLARTPRKRRNAHQ